MAVTLPVSPLVAILHTCHLLLPTWCVAPPAVAQEISLSPTLSIGVLDDPAAETFGRIEDIAVDDEDRIYVLDYLTREIRVFTSGGRHLQTVGREGGGPGEFQAPLALTVGPGAALHVADGAGRITIYRLADTLEYAGSFRTGFSARDLCAAEGYLFVAGYFEGHVIHKFQIAGDTGELVASFGESTAQPPLPTDYSMPQLACIPDPMMLVVTGGFYPTLKSYSTSGQLIWSSELPDFRQMSITVEGEAWVFGFPDGPRWNHSIQRVVPFPHSRLAVQLLIRRPRGEVSEIETRVVSAEGTELYRQRLPFEFVVARSPLVYGKTTDPYPQVIVAQMTVTDPRR